MVNKIFFRNKSVVGCYIIGFFFSNATFVTLSEILTESLFVFVICILKRDKLALSKRYKKRCELLGEVHAVHTITRFFTPLMNVNLKCKTNMEYLEILAILWNI